MTFLDIAVVSDKLGVWNENLVHFFVSVLIVHLVSLPLVPLFAP